MTAPINPAAVVAAFVRHLDRNLHCQDCGRLHGILGEVIAEHARRVAAEGRT